MGSDAVAPGVGARRARRGALALIAAVVLVAGACGSGPRVGEPSGRGWASGAQRFVDDLHEAYGTGFTNVATFHAADAHIDWRGLLGYEGTGRAPFTQLLRDELQPIGPGADPADRVEVTAEEPVYVSLGGALDPLWVHAPGFPHWSQVQALTLSDAGIVDEAWAGALYSAGYSALDAAPVKALVGRYLSAWSSGDPAAVASRYEPGATLTDSLLGLGLVGQREIGRASSRGWADGGLPDASLRQMPRVDGDGGGAAYVNLRGEDLPGDVVALVLLLDATDDRGCPHQVGIRLDVEESRITHEERYHRIDSLARCAAVDELPDGWWDSVPAPDPQAFTTSGSLAVFDAPVTLWNSTPQREGLLRWALQQFADHGLPPPVPLSVTFAPFEDDPWEAYGFVPGAVDVLLPASWVGCAEPGCDPWPWAARRAALDALARLWVSDSTRRPSMVRFAQRRGLPFDPAGDAIDERTAQEATRVIAGALMPPITTWTGALGIPGASCTADAADFEALTMAAAPHGACEQPTQESAPEGS
jgi:hypothetical protein